MDAEGWQKKFEQPKVLNTCIVVLDMMLFEQEKRAKMKRRGLDAAKKSLENSSYQGYEELNSGNFFPNSCLLDPDLGIPDEKVL